MSITLLSTHCSQLGLLASDSNFFWHGIDLQALNYNLKSFFSSSIWDWVRVNLLMPEIAVIISHKTTFPCRLFNSLFLHHREPLTNSSAKNDLLKDLLLLWFVISFKRFFLFFSYFLAQEKKVNCGCMRGKV